MFLKKIQTIREFLQKDQIRESIIELNDLLEHLVSLDSIGNSLIKDYKNKVILLVNRFKRVKSDIISNTKSSDKILIEKNNIISSYLMLLSEIEEMIFDFQNSSAKIDIREPLIMLSELEYLIYLSDSKMDMLSSQVDHNVERPENNIIKLRSIISKLESNDLIGGIDDSKPYVYGEVEMYWGIMIWNVSIFYSNDTTPNLLLFGSAHNLLGEKMNTNELLIRESNNSSMFRFLTVLGEYEERYLTQFEREKEGRSLDSRINRLTVMLEKDRIRNGYTKEKVKFIARKYKSINVGEESKSEVVLGSPVFVSLSNEF